MKKTIITDHGIKITKGKVKNAKTQSLDSFQKLALHLYPHLYTTDKHGVVRRRKNQNYEKRLSSIRKKHELGGSRSTKTPI